MRAAIFCRYSWEKSIQDKITEVRAKELKLVRHQRFLSAFLGVFMTTQPLFVTVVTFSVYAASGRPFTASNVLPALALLAMIRLPIAFLPMVLMQIANLKVSAIRVSKFLMNEELPTEIKERCLAEEKLNSERLDEGYSPTSIAGAVGELLADGKSVITAAKDAANAAVNMLEDATGIDINGDGTIGGQEAVKTRAEQAAAAAKAKTEEDGEVKKPAALGDISIEGSFRWLAFEAPVARGRGRGGRGGRGGGAGRGNGAGAARGGGKGRWSFKMKKAPPAAAADTQADATTTEEAAAAPGEATPVTSPTLPPTTTGEQPPPITAEKSESAGGGGGGDKDPATPSKKSRSKRRSKEEVKPKPPPPPTLHQLSVTFPSGQLTMIAGAVGSGKSSLLCALLGELRPASEPATEGSGAPGAAPGAAAAPAPTHAEMVKLEGTIGYFSQTPFILNDTVRGNILLGAPMDEEWYQTVLSACALLPDLKILPGGDMTQIGEKGINLSGGQKARVALARACYAKAPTLLLDDPLSAVDAHVGKHIFREVLGPNGLLDGTTRILVTHQTHPPLADKVVLRGWRRARSGRVHRAS